LRTVLFDVGEKVYAVAALRSSSAKDAADLEVVQMAFLEAMKW
jgi:hypothetical protein